jgi:hypothetical protein
LVTFQLDVTTQDHGWWNLETDLVGVYILEWQGGVRDYFRSLILTNDSAGLNPYLFTGTFMDTNDAPGTTLGYRFYLEEADWGGQWLDLDRTALLPPTNGASLVLPLAYFGDTPPGGWPVTNTLQLTFQVDMSEQAALGRFTLGTGPVDVWEYVDYDHNGGLLTLSNDSSSPNPYLFTGTLMLTNFVPGSTRNYKFYYAWKSSYVYEEPLSTCGDYRVAVLPSGTNATLVLPVVYFDDLPPGVPLVTNSVTYQVDMSAQFSAPPDLGWRRWPYCTGSFNGGQSLALTNDPSAGNTNIYRGTLQIISLPGARMDFHFGYLLVSFRGTGNRHVEELLYLGSTNRTFNLLTNNGDLVLPPVLFGDLEPGDVLPAATLVRFNVDMTGAVGVDGHPFDPVLDRIFVNGDFADWFPPHAGGKRQGWWPWNPLQVSTFSLSSYYLTNVPGTPVFTGVVALDRPRALVLTYRYSINGQDNEPTGGQNHIRFIRTTGEYALPLDKFGAPVQEPSFGNLTATRSDPDHVLISWLGRPGVHLQSCSSANRPWQDYPETDGLSATNWPTADGERFFRLAKP